MKNSTKYLIYGGVTLTVATFVFLGYRAVSAKRRELQAERKKDSQMDALLKKIDAQPK